MSVKLDILSFLCRVHVPLGAVYIYWENFFAINACMDDTE